MNTQQPLRPSMLHLTGAGIVLLGCELFMAAIWAFLAMRETREIIAQTLAPALLMIAIAVVIAWKQYQAIFLLNATAASSITQLLVFAVVMITIPFVDLTSMQLLVNDPRLDQGWYVLCGLWLTTLFSAATNWSWSTRLRSTQTQAIQPVWQWRLATMLAAMTVLSVQFALAGFILRCWGG